MARLTTACGVAVEEVAFFNDSEPGTYLSLGRMDNPDFWHEVSVTWSFLGADRVVAVFTPDDDHVGLMAEASAGFCGEVFATPTMSVMLFRMVVFVGLDRCPRAIEFRVFMMKIFSRTRPMDRVLFGSGASRT